LLLLSHAAQLLTLAGPDRARRGKELTDLGVIRDGAVLVNGERIVAAGPTDVVTRGLSTSVDEIDCRGMLITPGLVDSHTHLVFAGARLDDFERRLAGATYEEIARSGGGIRSSVERLCNATDESLTRHAERWMAEARRWGTTTIEVKSGYGLRLDHELRMLAAAETAGKTTGLKVIRTFLGAHTIPSEYDGARQRYVDELIDNMLPEVAKRRASEFCDVFCDRTAFTIEEAEKILRAAASCGLKLKIHADQLSRTGAAALGIGVGATSVDHLDHADASDFAALAASSTVATLLPGANFFMGSTYPAAREMIAAGVAVALATDFNPGTCPMIGLPLVMSLACTQMRMTPAEVWAAVTLNGAAALALAHECGSLTNGKRADLAVFNADDFRAVPYFAGANLCRFVIVGGKLLQTLDN
jgi:imidazolonepropionase